MPRRAARPRSAEKFRPFREILLQWFDAHARPLPWRESRDPYRIWVSEVMLQQTTAAAVGPKFRRFVEQFPDLESLATADEANVLAAWQGLGYYRRARHLHAGARRLWAEYGSQWPVSPDVWAELPGVGRYMLGAIMSQAFGQRLPVVDANVRRVLCRWFGQDGLAESGAVVAWMWETAGRMIPAERPGDFNQALMELGRNRVFATHASVWAMPSKGGLCGVCRQHAIFVTRACKESGSDRTPRSGRDHFSTWRDLARASRRERPLGRFLGTSASDASRWGID